MKVVLTDAALSDLQALGDHIGGDSPKRARTFVAEFKQTPGRSIDHPGVNVVLAG